MSLRAENEMRKQEDMGTQSVCVFPPHPRGHIE